jgi:hypothetical protein
MRIAQLAPLAGSVPPKLYGDTGRVIAWVEDRRRRESSGRCGRARGAIEFLAIRSESGARGNSRVEVGIRPGAAWTCSAASTVRTEKHVTGHAADHGSGPRNFAPTQY